MEFKTQEFEDGVIFRVEEDIDYYNSDELEKELDELIQKYRFVIFVMKDIHYIDSSGLGTLTGILRKAKDDSKEFLLADLSNDVKNIFELTHLLDFFKIFDNLDDALDYIKGT